MVPRSAEGLALVDALGPRQPRDIRAQRVGLLAGPRAERDMFDLPGARGDGDGKIIQRSVRLRCHEVRNGSGIPIKGDEKTAIGGYRHPHAIEGEPRRARRDQAAGPAALDQLAGQSKRRSRAARQHPAATESPRPDQTKTAKDKGSAVHRGVRSAAAQQVPGGDFG